MRGGALSKKQEYKEVDIFKPHDWQIEVLNSTDEVLLLTGSAGGGKLLPLDTPIPTPSGWKTMGEIQVGNLVIGADGMPTRVVGISDVQYPRKAYRIEFDDKSSIIAGSDHQWLSHTNAARASARNHEKRLEVMGGEYVNDPRGTDQRDKRILPSVVTTEEMLETLTVGDSGRKNHAIQVARPIQLPERTLPISPYCLGMWLGDGDSGGGGYTVHADDVFLLDEWERYGYEVRRRRAKNRPTTIRGYIIGLLSQLRELGVLNNKRIPTIYLRGSFQQRLELLQGLIDTDGHVNKHGQTSIDMARYDLMCDIRELVLSLGIKARIREGSVYLSGKEFVRYRMKFTTNLQVARLPRKRNRLPLGQELRGTQKFRYVTSITEVPNVLMKCIEVDNDDHLYLAGESFIPTHNSRVAAEKIHAFLMTYPGSTALVVRKTKSSMYNSTVMFLKREVMQRFIQTKRIVHNNTERRFEYWNGSILVYSGMKDEDQKESIRSIGAHGGIDICWMEEATQFEESDFNEILSRMRGSRSNWRQIILTTNPNSPMHWIHRRLMDGKGAKVIYSRAADNPSNPADYEGKLDMLTGIDRDRLRDGIWTHASGLVFDQWRDAIGDEETNVTVDADYIDGGGPVMLFVDDGYAGEMDEDTGFFKPRSHPRVFLFAQQRADGTIAIFDESYRVETLAPQHIDEIIARFYLKGYSRPTRVIYDRSAASLGGHLKEQLGKAWRMPQSSIVFNRVPVEDGNKLVNTWVAPDQNGIRKIIAHPRCKHLRSEMITYQFGSSAQDGKPRKDFDHGPDALRMGLWDILNGESMSVDVSAGFDVDFNQLKSDIHKNADGFIEYEDGDVSIAAPITLDFVVF